MKVGKVRFEAKILAVEGVAPNHYTRLYDPRSLTDKLTLLFELRQDRRMSSHLLRVTHDESAVGLVERN